MIYTYMKPTSNVVESIEATRSEELVSIAYNEYCNYKEMLENCTDESAKPILEAQVEVLREVGIKDIITKIKEAFANIFKKISEIISRIKKFISDKFAKTKETIRNSKDKIKILEKLDNKIKIIFESSNYESELSGIFKIAVNNNILYFDYYSIMAPNKSYTDDYDNLNNAIYDVINGKPLPYAYTINFDGTDENMFAFGVKMNRVVIEEFNTNYLESSDNNFNAATNKYLEDLKNKKEYNTCSKIYKRCLDIESKFNDTSNHISVCLEKLKKYEGKINKALSDLESASNRHNDDNKPFVDQTFLNSLRLLTKSTTNNISIINQSCILLQTQKNFADSIISRVDVLLDKIKID